MEIKTTYIGINQDGIKCVWCGFKPDNTTILKEIQILYPAEGYVLRDKETREIKKSVILFCPELQDDYEEIDERTINNGITD